MLGELDLHARATASAELAAMQAQIEPHFLFNALNTIAAFCRTQPDEARRLVLAFAELLPAQPAPPRGVRRRCATSCGHVEAYVALERARFGDQLEVDVRVTPAAEIGARAAVARATAGRERHQARQDRPAAARRGARRGAPRPPAHHGARQRARHPARARRPRRSSRASGSGAAGLGLASAAQRVAVFYGEHGRLRIASAPRIGTLVSIVIPTVPPGHEQDALAQ